MGRILRLFIISGLFSVTNVGAAIVDNGLFTSDTDTGLMWLDANQTLGWSYDGATSYLANGGTLAGYSDWRYATGAELNTLLGNFGLFTTATVEDVQIVVQNDELMGEAINILGATAIYGDGSRTRIHGILEDIRFQIGETTSRWSANLVFDDSLAASYSYLHFNSHSDLSNSDLLGSFLVRASPVPLPAAFPLFASVLGMFGLFNWTRRKRVSA
jgi:hypothetical protein